jgi:hypothetical protein
MRHAAHLGSSQSLMAVRQSEDGDINSHTELKMILNENYGWLHANTGSGPEQEFHTTTI